jgi:hypothetical protein
MADVDTRGFTDGGALPYTLDELGHYTAPMGCGPPGQKS